MDLFTPDKKLFITTYNDQRMDTHLNLDMEQLDDAFNAIQALILNYRHNLYDEPVYPELDYHDLQRQLTTDLPMTGTDYPDILSEIEQLVIPGCTKVGHPRFLAWMNNSSCDAGMLGEMLNIGLAQVPFTFKGGQSATIIEHLVGQWFCRMFNYPEQSAGSMVSGGTVANLTAVMVAREAMCPHAMSVGIQNNRKPLRLYMSTHGHVSLERAIGISGIGIQNIVKIETDAAFRMNPARLEEAIREDLERGYTPFCVVAQAGSATVGAVDDIQTIADLCEQFKLWLHVDAAYGGAAILTEHGQRLYHGIQRADSITTDPHKWFYMPVEAGLVLFKNKNLLHETFLQSSCTSYRGKMDAINLMNNGIQIAQTSKAFKVWFALKFYGIQKITACIEKDLRLASVFSEHLKATGKWELMNEAQLSTVCIRYVADATDETLINALQYTILDQLELSGKALLAPTILSGKVCIRVCFANHRTTLQDVTLLIETLTNIGDRLYEAGTIHI